MARPSDPSARQRILDAARNEFVAKGLDRTRVEDIARTAKLSKGAFYLHFESKEQLFDELVLGVAHQLEQMLESFMSEDSKAASSATHWVQRCFEKDLCIFEFALENRGMMALIFEGGGSARHQHLIESFARRTERLVAELLRQGIAHGFYRADLDVESAAAFIAGGYDRVARRLVNDAPDQDPGFNLAEHLANVIRQLVAGVGTAALVEAVERSLPSWSKVSRQTPRSNN
jgi:AcrR family transcriptional regulator